jgi:glycosyltransferase involved in cell wall biosynthesis
MRMTFCTTDGANAFNGINAWLLQFLPSLRARGHDARVLLFPWSRPEQCTTYPLLLRAGVPVDVVYPPRYTEAAVRACLCHARSFRPDVFVANMVIPALYAGGWLRAAGIPTVAVAHNDDSQYHARLELCAGKNEFFHTSAIVFISRGLLHLVGSSTTQAVIRCIPYGVPLSPSTVSWDGCPPLRLIYHGRITQEQKRIRETVAACVRVANATQAIEAEFYGSGPDESIVTEMLARNNASGRVRFLGRIESSNVMSALAHHHVAVLLSDYEGLGLSILEGMACGLVPICFRTASGLPDIIAHDENGLFIDNREAGFDRAVGRLLAEPATWTRFSSAARATVVSRFSVEASLAAWEDLAMAILPTRSPPLQVPQLWRMNLPPVHSLLRQDDSRFPGFLRAAWRAVRFRRDH